MISLNSAYSKAFQIFNPAVSVMELQELKVEHTFSNLDLQAPHNAAAEQRRSYCNKKRLNGVNGPLTEYRETIDILPSSDLQ